MAMDLFMDSAEDGQQDGELDPGLVDVVEPPQFSCGSAL